MTSYTPIIIKKLTELYLYEKNNNNKFKAIAYNNAIQNLKDIHVHSIDDIKNVKGIGKSIFSKIENIINDNSPVLENISFTNIYGIGPAKSNELIQKHKISSIDELRNNTHLLNDKQKIGLKYYDDLLLRIPYKEMEQHANYIYKSIQSSDPSSTSSIVGSFRRKKQDSGDIDVLMITDKSMKEIVSNMSDYILEILALSDKKFMGICKIDKVARRIDMLKTTVEEFPYAQLYFTGSKDHNIIMRKKAKNMGFSLNEKGLIPNKGVPIMKNEEDIFKFLDIVYKDPEER
tara:strand:+ start:4405 stop:5271 length:867 start_codon:yes stop_codon:yes gene_type:complete